MEVQVTQDTLQKSSMASKSETISSQTRTTEGTTTATKKYHYKIVYKICKLSCNDCKHKESGISYYKIVIEDKIVRRK